VTVQGIEVQGSGVQGSEVQGSGFRVQRFKVHELKNEPQNRRISNVESSEADKGRRMGSLFLVFLL
jgi:hypothetical protein